MKKATYQDKDLIIDILSKSFYDNLSVNYIIKEPHNESQIIALMEYSFEQCFLFGEVFLSKSNDACALILYPQQKQFSLKAIGLDIKLIFKAIGPLRIFKALKRESAIKKLQPKIEMTYLWFIGVLPKSQQTGVGSQLLNEIVDFSKSKNLPIFLETSTIKNIPWYKKFGFQIYDKLNLGYELTFLKH